MKRTSDVIWLDLGDFDDLVDPPTAHATWQDHGLGLLRTILHNLGTKTDLASIRNMSRVGQLRQCLQGYHMLVMNVRSYTFPSAYRAARIFKKVNPKGIVIAGGMHATVALDEMAAISEFDHICQGGGEKIIGDLISSPSSFERIVHGGGMQDMNSWPMINRTLWPRPVHHRTASFWPLEADCGWAPPPVATILTSRVCPWQCSFCNEASYIQPMRRRAVTAVIDELNRLDKDRGPLGSVVIHDSTFFQNPGWLKEWTESYPGLARNTWPYWAAARSDMIRKWPDLFEEVVKRTNWRTISVGLESGSDRVLQTLNKECTSDDNNFAIDLINRIGDEMEAAGHVPPSVWANVMLAIPGETQEDAFMTARMLKRIRRAIPSLSFYAPYPGSVLGHQLIAEGKSLMSKMNYHRSPSNKKVKGMDYQFYADLLAGKHEASIDNCLPEQNGKVPSGKHHMYLFDMVNGRKKLAYGRSPEDALNILRYRLSPEEIGGIVKEGCAVVSQRDLPRFVSCLG